MEDMGVSIRIADRIIVQTGASLGNLDGCAIETIDDTTATRLAAALGQPSNPTAGSRSRSTRYGRGAARAARAAARYLRRRRRTTAGRDSLTRVIARIKAGQSAG